MIRKIQISETEFMDWNRCDTITSLEETVGGFMMG